MIDAYIHSHQQKEYHAKQFALTQKNIEKIKKISIKKIEYPEFKEAYEYVDDLFPAAHVKDVIIHKVMAKGHTKSSAYAICVTSTGCRRAKGGRWICRK